MQRSILIISNRFVRLVLKANGSNWTNVKLPYTNGKLIFEPICWRRQTLAHDEYNLFNNFSISYPYLNSSIILHLIIKGVDYINI